MTNPDNPTPENSIPEAGSRSTLVKPRPRWSASLIWLVPAIAVLLGLAVAVRAWSSTGPHIQISFNSADGLEAGKTQVRFKSVVIGSVKSITLADDQSHVVVDVQLGKSAHAFARTGSRFWVVRPRIGTGGISGIDTLLSGAFIAADAGKSDTELEQFTGLENPPAVTQGEAGREFILRAEDLGSLSVGSPVYFRRIQVGRVAAIQLGQHGRGITMTIFVSAPYDSLVSTTSRFWNASGLDVSLSANGLKVNTQSLATVIEGGIAFATPDETSDPPAAPANTKFTLAEDEKTALAPPDGDPVYFTMRFPQSLRGLAVNAPVEFKGIELGHVTSIDLDYDPKTQDFFTTVASVTYPQRLGRAYAKLLPEIKNAKAGGRDTILATLVDRGLRAQARSGNLITGQLYIAIDIVPGAAKVAFNGNTDPIRFPTVPGQFDKLQDQVASIVDKFAKVPFDSIGKRLDTGLGSLDETLQHVNGDLVPALKQTLEGVDKTLSTADQAIMSANQALGSIQGLTGDDSALRRDFSRTMEQLQRSAVSLRELADYLGRHPESLIRGRAKSADTPAAAPAPATSASQP